MVDVDLIGEPVVPADIEYKKKLVEARNSAEKKVGDRIHFVGNVPNKDIPPLDRQSDLSINLCPTGGLDKVVLESLRAFCALAQNARRETGLVIVGSGPEKIKPTKNIVLENWVDQTNLFFLLQNRRRFSFHFALRRIRNVFGRSPAQLAVASSRRTPASRRK